MKRLETDAVDDPLVTLVRSAASDEGVAAQLLVAMQERSLTGYRSALSPGTPAEPDDDLDARVALIGAQLIGLVFSRYIARTEPLASMPPDQLTEHLARILRYILPGSRHEITGTTPPA